MANIMIDYSSKPLGNEGLPYDAFRACWVERFGTEPTVRQYEDFQSSDIRCVCCRIGAVYRNERLTAVND